MDGSIPNRPPAPVLGLEPRYLRERRKRPQPEPDPAEAPPSPLPPVVLWFPDSVRPTDKVTPELRRRVLAAAEPGLWQRLPIVVPVMFVVSALLWFGLFKIAVVFGHLLD